LLDAHPHYITPNVHCSQEFLCSIWNDARKEAMTMSVLDAIKNRASYRGPYQNTTVPREDLIRIMEAGLAAPSGCNAQTAYLIGIDDGEIIKKMAALLDKPKAATAPAAVCVISHAHPTFEGMYFNIQDYSAAIENMLLAISALGYATCWIEGEITQNKERQKAFSSLLGVPEGYDFVAFLPLGIPVEPGNRAVHKPFGERAFFNRFGGS
jgi:nitroreductase